MLTTMTPFAAMASNGEPDAPCTIAPPWIQTITGSGFAEDLAGRQTLRVRQSSDFGTLSVCMQAGPKRLASFTPAHASTGCGTRQRRSPTGGAAYGIPFQLITLPAATPPTDPPSTMAMSGSTVDCANALRAV